ncbi:MAG TPA: hypothetical protein VFV67_05645 [Actinophytocola sp.]|uniref:hypothetical protein n=1 Tax=Actinophytocola sp. TaxID=1872138 RepID=UPI002DB66DE6|nr:hypothetical protein [Actinophytocola sp.]HEU5470118.1 hypothetical protein [Actinophytocola sp.]
MVVLAQPAADVWFFGRVDADVFAAWGEAMGAACTFLAVVVALGIALRDGRYRDAERRDNEIAHARLVCGFRESDPPRLVIGYTNHGTGPITSVRLVDVVGRFGEIASVGWSIGGSSEPYVLAAIRPGQTVTTPPITVAWPDGCQVDEKAALYYPTILFVDGNGRWWERRAYDQPRRLFSSPAPVARLPVRTTPERDDSLTRLH